MNMFTLFGKTRLSPLVGSILHRFALGVLTLFLVSTLIFFSADMLPGDFASAILGQSATPETIAAFRRSLGLDQPLLIRYIDWISGILHGDFGTSFSSTPNRPRYVSDLLGARMANTFILAGTTAIIAVPLSMALGILAALYRKSIIDRAINVVTLTAISMPEFLVAYLLMFVFAIKFGWFTSLSTVSSGMGYFEILPLIILPTMTMTLVIVAHMMRMTRASIVNILSNSYIEMAHLKGVRPWRIVVHHALPNAWAPIAVIIAFNLAYLIVGVVVVEVVFAYPGIGQLMVDAVRTRDIPVVQACALIFASTYIMLNLAADIVAILTNPRLLHPK